eukprot:TRINITY_DN12064_c0_g1_i1.p1 TRINITY_DN12064_c0_g1~~TRINITY_DN12064_c0_g1_i1.p1  ORF type:complete len:118 (-),score=38.54 TRINITY_DN12064_c0_g1_i1:173-526(-)
MCIRDSQFRTLLDQLHHLRNYSFSSVQNLLNGKSLVLVPNDFDSQFNKEALSKIDPTKAAIALNMYIRLYFKRLAVQKVFYGKKKNEYKSMVGALQHLLRGLSEKADWGHHELLVTE